MGGVRGVSIEEGWPAALWRVRVFCKIALSNIRLSGWMDEAGVMGVLKLRTGEFRKNLGLGMAMVPRSMRSSARRSRFRSSTLRNSWPSL